MRKLASTFLALGPDALSCPPPSLCEYTNKGTTVLYFILEGPHKSEGLATTVCRARTKMKSWLLICIVLVVFAASVSPVAIAQLPQQGPFNTQSARFTVGGLVAGGSQEAYVYWPVDPAEAGAAAPARNVVAFGHGLKAGGEKMDQSYGALLRLRSRRMGWSSSRRCPAQRITA